MRICRVVEADFRFRDLGLWLKFVEANESFVQHRKADEVVVFVSRRGDQLLFVFGFETIGTSQEGVSRTMLPSTKYRLVKGTWEPYMLANYAKAAGLKIDGLKLMEEHFGYLVSGAKKSRKE